MYLYLISQDENNKYDTFDSAVVAAPNEATARNVDPEHSWSTDNPVFMDWSKHQGTWCSRPELVTVKPIGIAADPDFVGCLCGSFNAG